MAGFPLSIVNAGLVTSVGLSAPTGCAAIRAALTNHTETRFRHRGGEWIRAAQVPLQNPWRGRRKLVQMLGSAIRECLVPVEGQRAPSLPLLLCLAEVQRPGRLEGLDDDLLIELERHLGMTFDATQSRAIAGGRVGVMLALVEARRLIEGGFSRVLIAGADSLLLGPTLTALENDGRLLTPRNSNGFIPGEAAGAVLVSRSSNTSESLVCTGLGFAREAATILSEEPLRGDGLAAAIKQALKDAGREMHDLDFRITDNSGEQYYFKETALALSRTMHRPKERFDLWHPADCIGETGAAIGLAMLTVALTSCQKSYALGSNILLHAGNDTGERAATILRYESTN